MIEEIHSAQSMIVSSQLSSNKVKEITETIVAALAYILTHDGIYAATLIISGLTHLLCSFKKSQPYIA